MTAETIPPPSKLCPIHGEVTPSRRRNGYHTDGTPRHALRCPRCSVDATRRHWDRLAGKIPEALPPARVGRVGGTVSSTNSAALLELALGHELRGPAKEPQQAAPDADLFAILMGRA